MIRELLPAAEVDRFIRASKPSIDHMYRSARLTHGCECAVLILNLADELAVKVAEHVEAYRPGDSGRLLTAGTCMELADILPEFPDRDTVLFGWQKPNVARVVILHDSKAAAVLVPLRQTLGEHLRGWLGLGPKAQPIEVARGH